MLLRNTPWPRRAHLEVVTFPDSGELRVGKDAPPPKVRVKAYRWVIADRSAVFGWRQTGEILYLENRTTDWSRPAFVPHVLDRRHGTTHVPVADLNGDGKPDIVAVGRATKNVKIYWNEGK